MDYTWLIRAIGNWMLGTRSKHERKGNTVPFLQEYHFSIPKHTESLYTMLVHSRLPERHAYL
jgi:hypothetical protein